MGFTPKMRPDVALQRGIGTCDNGWDWGTLYLLQDAGVESGTGGFGGPLVGAQSILSNVKLWEKEEGVGLSTAGSQENLTSSLGSYMVVEARLVSSCLSLPSRARPRFSRLAASVGVMEYVLEKVELAATVSLEEVGQESSEPASAR